MLLGGLSVLAGTAIDMTDPQTSFRAILPGWLYPVFLLVILLGSITNNALTAYSSGLALQAVGVKASRAFTVLFDGVVGVALTVYALFISNSLDTLNSILELSVSLLGPSLAIYATDILLRRNRYDGRTLHDETSGSPFLVQPRSRLERVCCPGARHSRGVASINSTLVVGPIANTLGGGDLSALRVRSSRPASTRA